MIAAPMKMTARVVIRPQNIMINPKATISGLIVLYGMTIPSSSALFPSWALMRALSRSASLPSHSG